MAVDIKTVSGPSVASGILIDYLWKLGEGLFEG